jgi:hypothetical protein
MTARLLGQRLEGAGDEAGRARLQAVLDGLDPKLLAEPAYETEAAGGAGRAGGDRAGGGRGRGGRRRR